LKSEIGVRHNVSSRDWRCLADTDTTRVGKVEIVAIARRSADRLALAQQELNVREAYTDWREMLEKSALDAVVIATPPNAHAEPTLAALERGLHVFVEKPIALASADTQRMVEAVAKAGRTLMVGYNARGMGNWRTISAC
jgi:myo-inositol 2-dehydrogenase/D-chiro-inositol 1-dehydrogenase